MYQAMIDMLTCRVEEAKLRWKPSSLEFMVVDHSPDQRPVQITVTSKAHDEDGTGDVVLKYGQKEYLDVLGVRLDKQGSTLTSISTKLAAATKGIYADLKPGSPKARKWLKFVLSPGRCTRESFTAVEPGTLRTSTCISLGSGRTKWSQRSWVCGSMCCPTGILSHFGSTVLVPA